MSSTWSGWVCAASCAHAALTSKELLSKAVPADNHVRVAGLMLWLFTCSGRSVEPAPINTPHQIHFIRSIERTSAYRPGDCLAARSRKRSPEQAGFGLAGSRPAETQRLGDTERLQLLRPERPARVKRRLNQKPTCQEPECNSTRPTHPCTSWRTDRERGAATRRPGWRTRWTNSVATIVQVVRALASTHPKRRDGQPLIFARFPVSHAPWSSRMHPSSPRWTTNPD